MTSKKKVFVYAIAAAVAIPGFLLTKNIAHRKCVRWALETHCHKIANCQGVADLTVPWSLCLSHEYPCTAKLKMGKDQVVDVAFVAKKVTAADSLGDIAMTAAGKDAEDNWEVNMGLWGFIGDDYRIQNLKKVK